MRLPLVALFAFFLTASVPAQEIDQKEVCLGCHDVTVDTAVPHAPAQQGDCTACHNPHASRFEKLLQERPGPLCLSCHESLLDEIAQENIHEPVAEGRCADCHPPHGADHAKLLPADKEDICGTCHTDVVTWQSWSVQHSPFRRGKCSICHEPHAAPHDALARRTVDRMCLMCHRNEEQMAAAHGGYPIESAIDSCLLCHSPHASERQGLFQPVLHMPFEDGGCDSCHASPDAPEPFALLEGEAELCGACHGDVTEKAASAPFAHLSAGGGGCVACHNPHMGREHLLADETEDVCLACHDPGGSSSGEPGRHTTHAGLECTTCHDPHGGGRPLILAGDPIALCGDCHSHQHAITHPMGERARDPRSGRPMDCLSCHGIHDAPYEKYMHKAGDRDLCLSCHKNLERGP